VVSTKPNGIANAGAFGGCHRGVVASAARAWRGTTNVRCLANIGDSFGGLLARSDSWLLASSEGTVPAGAGRYCTLRRRRKFVAIVHDLSFILSLSLNEEQTLGIGSGFPIITS
jgi:hypothetical protein